jgi:hypothetical protein
MKKIIFLLIITIILSITNCGKPIETSNIFKIISTCQNPGYSQSIWLDSINDKLYAFIASGQAGLVIYNINNPESTYIQAQWLDTTNTCWDVTTLNNYAYLAYGKKELVILNCTNLDSIQYIDECSWPTPGYSNCIYIEDTSYIYVGLQDRLLVSEVSQAVFPQEYAPPLHIREIAISDSFAFFACEQQGVYIMNIKTTPRKIIKICDTPSNARGVFILDNTCYVADGRNGLILIDVSNPYQPSTVSTLNLSGYANRLYVKDSLAYIACQDAGLAIVNIKNQTQPVLVDMVKISYAKGVIVANPYIYVADRDLGLVIIKEEE